MSLLLNNADWSFPIPIHYGPGRVSELAAICKKNSIARPLLVTDSGSKELEFVNKILNDLNSANLYCNIFSGISPNPLGSEILTGKKIYHDGNHDAIIAIGGGSGMDGGKAISLIAYNSHNLWEFDNDKPEVTGISHFPKLICIPTTSGTGAETESTAMVTHEKLGMKFCVWHPKQKPIAAILDPKLTIGLPKNLTAWTGIDAIVHAIEAYSINSLYSVADAMAIESLNLLGSNLRKVVFSPNNIEARGAMLIGSCMAGISFLKGLGLVHAISHMVGAVYNSQHGRTNAILLPLILRFNETAISSKVAKMNFAAFQDTSGFDGFYRNVCKLLDDLEIDTGISALGVTDESVSDLAIKASKDAAAKTNPREASIKDLEEIISRAIISAR